MLKLGYPHYVLAALTTVYGVNLLDRGLIYILMESIKLDLQLTDTQLGFVTGIAFAVFHAVAGVPIARWADRGDRVTITSLAIGLWSLTTMACLLVTNFTQLLLVRIAAGVGDAGCQPPIYSILGDYFKNPAERTRAFYVFEAAVPLASAIAFLAGGWLNEVVGWRAAMLLLGVPGLFLAMVVRLTIREPRRTSVVAEPSRAVPFRRVLERLWRQPSCRHMTLGLVMIFILGQGVVGWQSVFMIRTHGMATGELGLWMAGIHVLGAFVGLAAGGYVLNRWFADAPRTQLRLAAVAVASGLPFYLTFLLAPSKVFALGVLIPHVIIFAGFTPTMFILLQRLVPDTMRASTMMLMLFFANLIGMGLGPQAVGILSDLLTPAYGTDGLRYAMMIMSAFAPLAGWHIWRAGQHIEADILAQEPAA